MNLKKSVAGLLLFSFILTSLWFVGASVAQEISGLDPSAYVLPHYESTWAENVFPDKKTSVEIKSPITMGMCSPCHKNLDDFSSPWLKRVNHGLHFSRGISCDSCHYENPHRPDGLVKIPMKVCFNCHGLNHGPIGELASGDCIVCHDSKKAPAGHTPEWKAKGHAAGFIQECVMCHKDLKKSCNDCHERERIRLIGKREYRFRPFLPDPMDYRVTVVFKIPSEISDCLPCHKDIEKTEVEGLIFSHEKHFKLGIKCSSCHNFYPHQPDKTYRIPMQSCYSCHQIYHGKKGLIASGECSLCHTPDFPLKPDDHTLEFEAGKHKERAQNEPSYCAMCHQDRFCQVCHLEKKVLPNDHKDVLRWRKEHGKDRKARRFCSQCHPESFCVDCHRVEPIPHPAQYLYQHGKQEYADKRVCNLCHTDRTFCESCHHYEVAKALLTKDNCVKCHPEYELKMLEIKSRGHMTHAAHFEMTNTPPFTCDKCHAQGYALGHDYATFQLCKECHGAYKLGKLIAKFAVDNGELCGRCHRVGSGLPVNVRIPSP